MTRNDLDRILSAEDQIVPSSGFATSVMDAVRREAATPPPIPFPWKRALPGFLLGVVVIVGLFVAELLHRTPESSAPAPAAFSPSQILSAARIAELHADSLGWIAFALLLTLASVIFALRVTGSRT
jgi:hypothetical protein